MQPDQNPQRVLTEAKRLAAEGHYEEALAKYLWIHEHSLDFAPAFAGVRLSFALFAWVDLGEKYLPARQTLLAVRDRTVATIENGEGSFASFHDVAAINRALGDDPETVRLFLLIHRRRPELARQCYGVAERILVEAGEYATCICYVPDPAQRLEELCQSRRMTLEIAEENPALGSPEARLNEYAEKRFTETTQRLIAILEGVGRTREADHVREVARATGQGNG